MKMLKMGLVGFAQGYYATLYSRICARRKDIDFVGVCDLGMPAADVLACAETTAEAFAGELGVPLFHRFEELMAQKPEALIVTCETADHHCYTLQALDQGVHVFTGKPLATTSAAARTIVAALEKKPGLIVLPGEPARYEDAMIQARQRLQAGEIGKPLMAHFFVNHPAMTNHAWQMDNIRSGGPLFEFGSYVVDLSEWIIGAEIVSVSALAANYMHPQIAAPDNAKILCRHSNGAMSSLDVCCSICWNYPFLGLEIIGEKGCLRADYHNYPIYVHKPEGCVAPEPRYSPMNQREIEHFIECVQEKAQPLITPQEFLSTACVLEAIFESLQKQTFVEVSR